MRTPQLTSFDGFRRRCSRVAMTALAALGIAGLGWLLAGCVPTAVEPLYRAADVIQDPALLGVWKDQPDGKDRWTFNPGEGKSYSLVIQSDDLRAVFVAHLFKLGDERFLDLYPEKTVLDETLQKNPYGVTLIPGHVFLRVRATDPALRMSSMGLDWLTQQLKRNPKAIAHTILPDDRVVLTGGTEAMQAFLKEHLDDAGAWNEMFGEGLRKFTTKPPDK